MRFRALKHRPSWAGGLFLTAVLMLICGCSHHVAPPAPSPVAPPPVPVFDGRVTIFTVATADQESSADANDLVPVPIVIDAKSKDPARLAIDALIAYHNSPIPHGTKLLDIAIDQTSGLATLNFSSEFKDNFPGGDTREAQVLNSVLETMGQFPNVQQVQFLVAGQKIGSLGGTQDLTDPLPIIVYSKEAASGG